MAQTPLQQLERLVGALSELVAQEHAMLTEQTWEDAAALEDRIQAVIGGITPLALDLGAGGLLPADFRSRLAEVTETHQAAQKKLAALMTQTRTELRNLKATEHKLTKMRPAYVAPAEQQARPSFLAQC